MSDNDNNGITKGKTGWSEHEIVVCLINAIEKSGIKLDFNSISYPSGRTASGFTQKLAALKKTLKPEIDTINSGQPVPEVATSFKNGGGRKRKVKDDNASGEYEGPKKRGRARKKFNTEVQEDVNANVKDEPDSELEIEVKI